MGLQLDKSALIKMLAGTGECERRRRRTRHTVVSVLLVRSYRTGSRLKRGGGGGGRETEILTGSRCNYVLHRDIILFIITRRRKEAVTNLMIK